MLRNATVILLSASLAMAAPPADPEIPATTLAQEARTRAAFTPADRARASALGAQLSSKMSIKDVNALVARESAGVAFAVLIDYLKILQREAREDRKIAGSDAEKSRAARQGKLEQDKAKIDDMKREAAERFDHAMSAASWGMAIGIASCAAAALSSVGSYGGPAGSRKSEPNAKIAPQGVAAPTAPPVAARVPVPTPTKTPSKSSGSKSPKG